MSDKCKPTDSERMARAILRLFPHPDDADGYEGGNGADLARWLKPGIRAALRVAEAETGDYVKKAIRAAQFESECLE